MGQLLSDLFGSSNEPNIQQYRPTNYYGNYRDYSATGYSNSSVVGDRIAERERVASYTIPEVKAKPEVKEVAWKGIEETLRQLRLEEAVKRREETLQIRLRVEEARKIEAQKRELLKKEKWIKHYCISHKILLVGEGDFSFSACLAKAFGSASNMVATSLDSIGFLEKNYKKALSNINEIRSRGGMVIHEVDATQMANYHWCKGIRFNRVVYNFPLAGFFPHESREFQISRNQKLVKLFLMNAKQMISEDGEIHITHKSNGFYSDWNLKGLALLSGLELIDEVNFAPSDYPGYDNKYGFGGDRNFDCNPSRTYKFALSTRPGLRGKGYIDIWD